MTKTNAVKPFSESRCKYKNAGIVLAGVPLDATGSFRCGTRSAPASVREISWHLEDYGFAEERSILDASFFDAGDIGLTGDLKNNLRQIEAYGAQTLKRGKKLLCIGGEHLITYPLVRALSKTYDDLCVVVFDAHTDLGDSSGNRKLSHASVMKLVYDIVGRGNIFMFGTRSGTREDKLFMKENLVHSAGEPTDEILRALSDKPVYISVDVDVLDPSVAPGVTTPELLGWTYERLAGALDKLSQLGSIVGADVVEICPPCDPADVTSLIGASLIRKLIFLMDVK